MLRKVGVLGKARQRRLHPLERAALHREDEADWFAAGEAYPMVPPGEPPIHREAIWRPIGFHDPGQRCDPALDLVGRTTDPEIPAWRRAEQRFDVERQHTLAKQRHGWGRPGAGAYDHILDARTTSPIRDDVARAQDFPAMCVGDVERKTPIGKGLGCRIHPGTRRRRGSDQWLPAGMKVADKIQRIVGRFQETDSVVQSPWVSWVVLGISAVPASRSVTVASMSVLRRAVKGALWAGRLPEGVQARGLARMRYRHVEHAIPITRSP